MADSSGGAFGNLEGTVTSRSSSREWSIGNVFRSRRSDTETVTERVTTVDAGEPMSSLPPPPPPTAPPPVTSPDHPGQGRSQPVPQSGLLTAGDYDDLRNPLFYANYASGFLQGRSDQLPFVDTREKFEIRVTDRNGRPAPHVLVRIPRAEGEPLVLQTAADGRAVVFPRFDRIREGARAMIGTGQDARIVPLAQGDGVTVRTGTTAAPVRAADILIVLDTTGSMSDEIDYLEAELDDIMGRLRSQSGRVDIRVGMIVYRDEGDEYVTRKYQFTDDISAMQATLAQQAASGGGDTPEAVQAALTEAGKFQWRSQAAKILLHVADAPPHQEDLDRTLRSTQDLRSKGVQFVPVAASGVDPVAEYAMRTMAVMTQGRYIFITDDSGIGNPHAEPTVDCYQVTPLNSLIARVMSGMIQGRRIEAEQGEVIRRVGIYDQGRCTGRFDITPRLTSRPLPVWEG
jgi:hypothetical protein